MITPSRLAPRVRRALILASAIAVAAATNVGPFGARVAAQPPLEVLHQRLMPIFDMAGVVFTDADENTGRLVVGVLDRDVEGLLRARFEVLGVRSQDVDVVESEPILQLVGTLRDSFRPAPAGVQIRFSNYVCSLGFNATRKVGNSTVNGFVTASHCSTNQGAVDGTQYYQPLNQVPGELLGTETVDPAYKRKVSGCPPGRVCRWSDANFVALASGVPFVLGSIAQTNAPNNLSLDVTGSFSITADGDTSTREGDLINKVGRTTGWGQGTLTRKGVNTGVSGSNIVLLGQNFVESADVIVQGGDSGSPVFKITGGNSVTLVGNLWGGNSDGTMFVYSPLEQAKSELGGTITTH